MRKSINIILFLTLILGCTLTLSAQAIDEELDQKELTKQFIGNWVTDDFEGTVVKWNVNPLGNGYEITIIWENEGQPTRTDKGIMGFTSDGLVNMTYMWSPEGNISCDYGKFVSKNKNIMERYATLNGKAVASFDFEFISPEKMKMIWKSWGTEGTPEDAEVFEATWTKVSQ
jgi:hypothetical protein